MHLTRAGLTLAVVASLLGCTPRRGDAADKHRAAADQLRQRLTAVAAAASKIPPPEERAKCAAPAPLAYSPDGASHDTEVLTVEELSAGGDPSAKPPEVSLELASPMRTLLSDTHPKSPLTPEERAARDGKIESVYARALAVKWIVAVRMRDADRTGGSLAVDYHLFPIDGGAPSCSGTFVARADPSLGTQVYDIVETDKQTGQRRVVKSGAEDRYKERLGKSARRVLGERLERELGITVK